MNQNGSTYRYGTRKQTVAQINIAWLPPAERQQGAIRLVVQISRITIHCLRKTLIVQILDAIVFIYAIVARSAVFSRPSNSQEANSWNTITKRNKQQRRCQTRKKPSTAPPCPSGSEIVLKSVNQNSKTIYNAPNLHHLGILFQKLPPRLYRLPPDLHLSLRSTHQPLK